MAMLGRGVQAQTAARARRIGFLAAAGRNNLAANVQAFREGLRDVGYREGRDIIVEYRYAEGRSEQLQHLAKELHGRQTRSSLLLLACGRQAFKLSLS